MHFTADLHIHSRFSRATSRKLTAAHLRAWAKVKGVHVLGTGDITHPAWRDELREHLVRDEHTGLYRCIKPRPVADEIPLMDKVDAAHGPEPLFMLQGEISSIYKRHGKVRRVHNLVFFPDLEAADKACNLLGAVANLTSDGRPIMGLDCCDLLEMLKDAVPDAYMIPAHVWTPWFALFGSKSGFDSVEECFGPMSSEIFALETGLSSDPAMNRLWSHLDGYTLISNSDAHSGENLAREVNIFHGSPSYAGIFAALQRQQGTDCHYGGTVEFFPEEGKYHLDGHRECGVVLDPHESMALNDICPVCGKPLTIGVLHRVLALADRHKAPDLLPTDGEGFSSLVPLPELLGELLQVGPKSHKVSRSYAQLIGHLGSELDILNRIAVSDLRQHWDALGEGIARMRRGAVIRQGGYDGEYGTVRVFTPQEAALLSGTQRASLLAMPPTPHTNKSPNGKRKGKAPATAFAQTVDSQTVNAPTADAANLDTVADTKPGAQANTTISYSSEQQAIITADDGPVLVAAGPGSGKTRTLVGRIQHLLDRGIPSRRILALTFTRRAATELEERLTHNHPPDTLPLTDTLHALAFSVWHKTHHTVPDVLSEDMSHRAFVLAHKGVDVPASQLRQWESELAIAREMGHVPPHLQACAERYAVCKSLHQWVDFTDLLESWLEQLRTGQVPQPWSHVLVDEIQDLSPLQLAVVRALLPADGTGFFGIGDPDQAIYGFRGAQNNIIASLRTFWPQMRCVPLSTNYRSAPALVQCAADLLGQRQHCGVLQAHGHGPASLHLFSAPHVESEAQWVAGHIRYLLGDTSHTLADNRTRNTNKGQQAEQELPRCHVPRGSYAPADIAVLVRLKSQIPPLRKALEHWGIPCAVPEQEGCWHHPLVALVLQYAAEQEHLPAPLALDGKPLSPQDNTSTMPPCPAHVWRGGPMALAAYLQDVQPFDALFWQGSAWKALVRLWSATAGWKGLLAHIHLLRDVEMVRSRAERVQIMTLHASKGLEFNAVFIAGLEEGLLPLHRERLYGPRAGSKVLANPAEEGTGERSGAAVLSASSLAEPALADALLAAGAARKPAEMREEERRLLYVGLTRASEALFCSHVQQRAVYGRTLELGASSFLRDISQHFRHSALVKKVQRQERQLSLF